MFKPCLAAAALVASATVAAAQSQGINGDLTLGYTYNDFDPGGASVSGDQWTLDSRMDFTLAPSVGIQGNAGLSYADVDGFTSNLYSAEIIPYYRLPSGVKIGVSAGLYEVDPEGAGNASGEEYTIQALFPVAGGSIQVGGGTGDFEGTNYDLAGVKGVLTVAPQWAVTGGYTWADAGTTNISEISLGVEWSAATAGFPVVVGLEAARMDFGSLESDRVGLNFSIPLGDGRDSLFANDTDVVREFFRTLGGP